MQNNIMKLFSKILLLFCLANVAMGAVNLRAEKSEELAEHIVKSAKAKSVELGAQFNAVKGAALSVRNLVALKAEENEDGWLGLALELSKADSLEDFLGDAAASDIESINAIASTALDEARRLRRVVESQEGTFWAFDDDAVWTSILVSLGNFWIVRNS